MENVITFTQNNVTLQIKVLRLPFSNNFVQKGTAVLQKHNGVKEVHVDVLCTQTSQEPGRLYYCIYSTKGDLIACNTLN